MELSENRGHLFEDLFVGADQLRVFSKHFEVDAFELGKVKGIFVIIVVLRDFREINLSSLFIERECEIVMYSGIGIHREDSRG